MRIKQSSFRLLARTIDQYVQNSNASACKGFGLVEPPCVKLRTMRQTYSRVRFFVQEAKRKICIFCVSWRSVMNFVRESLFAGARRKSGSVCRRAFATTNSDGGMPGRMVRSQDPNESQTSLVAATARYWSNPWAT